MPRNALTFAFMLIRRSFIMYIIHRDRCKGWAFRAIPACTHAHAHTHTYPHSAHKQKSNKKSSRSSKPSIISDASSHLLHQSSGNIENSSCDTTHREPYATPSRRTNQFCKQASWLAFNSQNCAGMCTHAHFQEKHQGI